MGMVHFAGRRIARIVPLYWCLTFGIAALALLAPKLLQSTQLDVPNLLRSLFFIPYARPDGFAMPLLFLGWTLNYEMFFYAVFALTLLIRPWSPIYACVPILGLVALGSMVDSNSVLFRFYTNPIMLDFVFGVLLFMLWARVGRVEIAAGHRIGFALAATALGIIGLSASIGPLYVLVHGLSAALLVAAALAVGAPGGAVGAALLVLGNASYSLYLSHPYILQAAARIFDHSHPWYVLAPVLAVAAAAAVAASILLYFSIELPAQRWLLRQWDGRRGEAQS
jgi:peptidoglycan/LPS O-acetylase OafA/YrhL